MPPKPASGSSAASASARVGSAKKKPAKLTKKQLEEQQAEMEAAQAAAAAAAAAREEAAALARAAAEREANELVVREDIQYSQAAPADVRAVMMRSFGHLYPAPPVPPAAAVPAVVAPLPLVDESAAALDSARPGSQKGGSSSKRAPSASASKRPSVASASSVAGAGASPRPPSSGSAAPSDDPSLSEKKTATAPVVKKASKRVVSAGKKRQQTLSSADVARHEAEEAAAAEQRAAEAAAAAAAAAAEAERLHPRWSPEVEAELTALRDIVAAKADYTATAESSLIDYYKSQASSDAAEAARLVNNGTRLHRGVDLPDEERRLAASPFKLDPQPGAPLPLRGLDTSIAARSLPPRGDKQILSSSGLIDLQSILDRQKARQAKVNAKVTQGAPPPPRDEEAEVRSRKHNVRRMAALDTSAGGASAGDATPGTGTHKSSPHTTAARSALLKNMMPLTEVKANQAILAHMQTLQSYPRNPRYDERNGRMGGPGGKGVMSSVKKARESAEEEKESGAGAGAGLDNLGDLAAALPQVSPRDDDTTAQLASTLSSLHDESSRQSCLQALPPVAWFTESYRVGHSYHCEIEVRNIGTLSRRIRVEGPAVAAKNGVGAEYFSVGQPRYPATSSSALLAPGMSCFVPVRFTPDALTDFASQLSVVTETGRIIVPLFAVRPKAGLDLPQTLEVGVCAWGDSLTRSWTVRNIGRTTGRFWMMDHSRFESLEAHEDIQGAQQASSRNRPILPDPGYAAGASFAKHAPPLFTSKALVAHLASLDPEDLEQEYTELELAGGVFKVSPASFELGPGQAVDLLIEYNPLSEARTGAHDPLSVESLSVPFLVVQDNSVVRRHALFGQTCDVRIEVAAVDGVDIEALHTRVAAAAQRSNLAASTARALKSSRPSSRTQPVPLASPPLLPRLDATVGPGSPRDEDAKRRQLPSSLVSPHPLRGQPDQVLDVSALPGLLTPRSPGATSRPSRLQLASSAAQERQIASQQAALVRAFGSLVFEDTEVGSKASKSVTLRNRTPLPVQFQWKQEKVQELFPQASGDDDAIDDAGDSATPFSIQPSFGSFPANSSITFHFSFHPGASHCGMHRSRTKFVVENVPENLAVDADADAAVAGHIQGKKARVRDEEKEQCDATHSEDDADADEEQDKDGTALSSPAFSSTLARARQETAAGSLIDVDYLVLSLQGLALGVPVTLGPQSGPLIVAREGALQLDGLPVSKWVEIANRSTADPGTTGAQTRFEFLKPVVRCARKQGCSDALLCPAVSDGQDAGEEEAEPLGELSITPSSGVLAAGARMRCLVSFVPRLLGRYTLEVSARVSNMLASCASSASKPDQLSVRFAFETEGPKLSFVCPPPAVTAVANLSLSPTAVASASASTAPNLGLLDFGLLNFGVAGVTSTRELVVRNDSQSARAWWSLGEQGQQAPAFLREDGLEPMEIEELGGGSSAQLESLGADADGSTDELRVSGGVLTFSPPRGILDPGSSVVVSVTFRPRSTSPLASHVALYTRHSHLAHPQYIGARAHVQAPVLSVLPCSIVMDMRTFRQMNDAEEEAKRQRAERERAEAAAAEAARVAAELAAKIEREKAVAAAKLAAEIAALAKATEERKAAEALALSQKGKKKPTAAALAKQKKEAEAAAAAAALAAAEAKAQEAAAAEAAAVEEPAAAVDAPADGDVTAGSTSAESILAAVAADVAPVAAPVNPAIFTSDSTVCVRVPRVFEVMLRNLTNLPAVYRWSVVGNGSTVETEESAPAPSTAVATDGSLTSATRSSHRRQPYEVRFSPSQGSLLGREERLVQITLVALVSGPMHLLLGCDIEGVATPLAVEIKANVKDLTVSYHALSTEEERAMTEELRATGFGGGGVHHTAQHQRSPSQSSSHFGGSPLAAATPRGLHSAGGGLGLSSPFLGASASGSSVAFSARSGRTDFSTSEGQEKLHARTAVLDRWVPAKQVHSKITRVEDEEEKEPGGGEEEEANATEASALEEEVLADGSTPAAIVPTASGLPSLDFGSAVAPGSRRTLVLVLRNHTVIPARFVASMARLRPSRVGVVATAAEGAGGKNRKKEGAAVQLLQKKKEAAAAAAVAAAATPSTPTTAAAGSALQAAKRLSAAAADSSITQRSATSSIGAGGDRSSIAGSTKSLRHGSSASGDLKAKPQPKKMLMLSASAEQESKLAFQSANGQQFTAQQSMRAADQAVIPAAQGVAFVLSASSGLLEPYSTYSLAVTVLTDANGEFRDELVLRVRGLGSVRIPVSVGVSGPCVSISRKTPGVLFPDSAVAARNKIEQVQGTVLSPVHAASSPASGSLESENAALKAAQPAAALVQHGFDRYPKLFFRTILVSAEPDSEPSFNPAASMTRALSGGGSLADAQAAFAHRLTYNTSARGAATARARQLQPEQFRNITLENAGPRDVKIVWKQFDLRAINHDRIVDVMISPRARPAVDPATGQEQLVQLEVQRYIYPDSTLSSAQATSAAAITARGDDTSRSSSGAASPSSAAPVAFPFVLDPPELVVPARGSASFRVIYDPLLSGNGGAEEVTHDLSFIEGSIFIAAPAAEDAAGAGELTSPGGALSVVEDPLPSVRSRKIHAVFEDIERFEAATGVTDPAGPDSDEDEDDAVSLASALSRTTPVLGGSSAAARRANAVAAYFAPKAAVDWQPAPEHLARHLFRLVLSGRTMVPSLFVDKAKGRLKFVVQVPRPESAPASLGSAAGGGSATAKDDFAKTIVRASSTAASPVPPESPSKTLRVNAVIPSVSSSPSSSSLRAQLTMVKLLPLENRSGTTLTFRVTVGPAPRFALQLPNHVDAAAASKTKSSKYASAKDPPLSAKNSLLASLSSALPPPTHLGWQAATAADASGASFTLGAGESLVLPIRFSAPHPEQGAMEREDGSEGEWPLRPSVVLSGQVSLAFSNGTVQSIPLQAELLRPQLDVSPPAHNFGSVHVVDPLSAFGAQSEEVGNGGQGGEGFASPASKEYLALLRQRKLVLTLTNPSLVDAHWSVTHLPRSRRPSSPGLRSGAHNPAMHPALLRSLASAEFDEDADTVDDPAAFQFAAQSGVVPAGAGSMAPAAAVLPSGVVTSLGLTAEVHSATFGRNLSGSQALLGSTKPEVVLRTPVQVAVQFRPRLKKRYRSRFLVVCANGANMGQPMVVELRGTGSFDEDLPVS